MDGFEVLRRLKKDPVTRHIPVIIKTAVHRDDAHRTRALQEGAAAYFAETFEPEALITAVRTALSGGAGGVADTA